MKLYNTTDVQAFIKAVDECKRSVFLTTPEGNTLDLKRPMELYEGIGLLVGENGDAQELYAGCLEDESRLLHFIDALDQAHTLPPAA